MKYIHTDKAAAPGGHYSQGIVHGGLLYISGQLAVDEEGRKHQGSIEEETARALANLEAILIAGGSSIDRVLKTTVYVSDIALWDRVNKVYSDFFGDHRPARAVVPTRELHYGFHVEIEAVAAVEGGE